MSEEKIDWLARVEELRPKAQQYTRLSGNSELMRTFCNLLDALSHLVDEYAQSEREYAVKAYVEEMLPYAQHVAKYDNFNGFLYRVLKPLVTATRWHPRLRIQVLKFWDTIAQQVIPHRSMLDTTPSEIHAGQRNIKLADLGVTDVRHYSTVRYVPLLDPVEWTTAWDEVIDKALRKTYAVLPKSEKKRGENFQERFYEKLAQLLQHDHGIVWRTPMEMKQVEEDLAKLPHEERYPKPDPLETPQTKFERAAKEVHKLLTYLSLEMIDSMIHHRSDEPADVDWGAQLHYIDCCIEVAQDRRDEVRLQPYEEVTRIIGNGVHSLYFLKTEKTFHDYAWLYDKALELYNVMDMPRPRLCKRIIDFMYILCRDLDWTIGDKEWVEAEKRYWDDNIYYADNNKPTKIKPHPKATLVHDTIEWSEEWEKVIDKVDELVEQELDVVYPNRSNYGVREWTIRARILVEEYNIVWLSPKELNPDMTFNE